MLSFCSSGSYMQLDICTTSHMTLFIYLLMDFNINDKHGTDLEEQYLLFQLTTLLANF